MMKFRNVSYLLILLLLLAGCVAPAATTDSAAQEAAPAAAAPASNALVDTEWVQANLDVENVRLLDIGGDPEAYNAGHLPGALFLPLGNLTNPDDSTRGQILTQDQLSTVMSELGVKNDDTLVLYDGNRNLLAARAYWVFKYYQHDGDVRLYDGGSTKWTADGQELSTEAVTAEPTAYEAGEADPEIRTTSEYVLEHLDDENVTVCDTRSPGEHSGTDVRADRGGHIPGSINLDWSVTVNEDGTFKDAAFLSDLYAQAGFTPDKEVITYCQTGVRGAHTWFVLKEVLGFPNVRNYDGSWEEWGNNPELPIGS